MIRWLFHLLAGTSFILLLISLWALITPTESVGFEYRDGTRWNAFGVADRAFFWSSREYAEQYSVQRSWIWSSGFYFEVLLEFAHREAPDKVLLGLIEVRTAAIGDSTIYTELFFVSMPAWFVALLASIMPTWWFVVYRKQSRGYRLKRGWCLACGYDLHGTAGKACPECGAERLQSTE